MSNRIVHISVQLFSNEELARHVTEECQLLDIMVTVLLYMMESCLIKSELQGEWSKCALCSVADHTTALLKNEAAGCGDADVCITLSLSVCMGNCCFNKLNIQFFCHFLIRSVFIKTEHLFLT